MVNEPTKKTNLKIALKRQHLSDLAKKLSDEACQVIFALISRIHPQEMSFVANLEDILEACPLTTNQVKQALDELQEKQVIREINNPSGQSYTVNSQTLEIIVIEDD
ncbi:hypothetical protein [Chroococcus sp. FPU101]|uniref:hypothetical protein n=1 Tax=Chroococcus sp. FPU101 TaxID=1974212 RepID=UPI001A8DDD69|nr:hypothetical protein [Chroococcus sp. FPU101]GFE72238.1 hypothetical protein CFPU101_48480 [Chroococcus sp. FPU101]